MSIDRSQQQQRFPSRQETTNRCGNGRPSHVPNGCSRREQGRLSAKYQTQDHSEKGTNRESQPDRSVPAVTAQEALDGSREESDGDCQRREGIVHGTARTVAVGFAPSPRG